MVGMKLASDFSRLLVTSSDAYSFHWVPVGDVERLDVAHIDKVASEELEAVARSAAQTVKGSRGDSSCASSRRTDLASTSRSAREPSCEGAAGIRQGGSPVDCHLGELDLVGRNRL